MRATVASSICALHEVYVSYPNSSKPFIRAHFLLKKMKFIFVKPIFGTIFGVCDLVSYISYGCGPLEKLFRKAEN